MSTTKEALLRRIRRQRLLARVKEQRAAMGQALQPIAYQPADLPELAAPVIPEAPVSLATPATADVTAVAGPGARAPRGSTLRRLLDGAKRMAGETGELVGSNLRAARTIAGMPGRAAGVTARSTARGLSEVGHRTAIGTAELVGADKAAANLRASRELARETYGPSETIPEKVIEGAAQLVGEGAAFMVPGAAAGRGLRALGAGANATGRAGRFLRLLADPQGWKQRAAQNLITGAPLDVAISQAGPEESLAGAGAELTGSETLAEIARDPVKRAAFEATTGFAVGEVLGEGLEFVARTRAARRRARVQEAATVSEVSTEPQLRDAVPEPASPPQTPELQARARAVQDEEGYSLGDIMPGRSEAPRAPQAPAEEFPEGSQVVVTRDSSDADFDELGAGEVLEVVGTKDAAPGMVKVRATYPGGVSRVFEVPGDAIQRAPDASPAPTQAAPTPSQGSADWRGRVVEPRSVGRRQRTLFPGDNGKVETQFAVMEADDIRASHTADYAQRPPEEFPPEIQGRAYHGPRGRQAREHTEQIVSSFDPERALDPTVSAADGPPVVTAQGINVAGNGRTIAMQRLWQGPKGELLRGELVRRAEEFGLDPGIVSRMEKPILVRRIIDDSIDITDTDTLRRLNAASDVATGKVKDVLSDAATRASQFRSATGAIGHFTETVADDDTIRGYLGSANGRTFFKRLVEDGVISPSERARFIDATTGAPTEEGKQLVERMFYAAAIGDADVVARAPEGILRKLDTALPGIIRSDRVEGWEVGSLVREALDLLASARAQGLPLDDLVAQVDLTRPAPADEIVDMARFLERSPKARIRDAFRGYAEDAESFARQTETEDLFGHQPKPASEAKRGFAALVPRGARGESFSRRFGATAARDRYMKAVQEGRVHPLTPMKVSEVLPSAGRFLNRAEAGPVASPVKVIGELNTALAKALGGLKVAEGKLPKGPKFEGALGIFKTRSQVIRLVDASDLAVFGHEAGHAMHKLLLGTTKSGKLDERPLARLGGAIRSELEAMSKGISDESLSEGWAEFWRRYVDNPDVLASEAPNLLRFVEGRLEPYPEVRNAWMVAREEWTAFRESGAQARIGSKISVGDREAEVMSLGDRWSRFRTSVLDDMEPIRRLVEAVREKGGLSMEEDAETLARLSRGSVGVGTMFLDHGAIDFATLQKTGPGLRQIIEPLKDNLDAFRRYMVARRARELDFRGIDTGFRTEDMKAVVAELEKAHGDTFRQAFADIQTWNRSLLAYLRDSGVISPETYGAILEKNQSYVPFYRVREGRRFGQSMGQTFGHLFSPVKKIRGSGRDVIDPLESLVKNAFLYTEIAQRQQVSMALARIASKEGMGELLERIGTPIRRQTFALGEVEGQIEELLPGFKEVMQDVRAVANEKFEQLTKGMSPVEILQRGLAPEDPAEELLAIFRPGDYFGKPNVISVLQNGKRVWYEVDEELYAALQGLNRESLDSFARFLGTPARVLRAGATLAPEFQIRNPIRDQVMAFVQSEYGYVPFVDMARGAFELVRKGEAYQQWLSAGGYRAALTSLDRNSMQNSVRDLLKTGGLQNVVKTPRDAVAALAAAMREVSRGQLGAAARKAGEAGAIALDPLRAASAVMEDATRMGEFLNARAKLGTSKEALQEAAAASREISVDFARHGAKWAFIRHTVAFWNARLQSYDRLARAARRNPQKFAAKAAALITVPSLLEYAANRDDPEYWELPQWQRDLFWMVKVGDDWLSIPKPFELGLIFGTLPIRILDSYAGHAGGAEELSRFFSETLRGELESTVPFPTAGSPLFENAVNHSFFLDRPIVPQSEVLVRDRLQGGPGTSEVAKMLARWIPGEEGVSPRSIDNLLYSWTGGLGRLGTELVDPILRGEGPAKPAKRVSELPGIRGIMDPPAGFSSESIERFYREFNRAQGAVATLRHLDRIGDEEGYEAELARPEMAELRQREASYRRTADALARLRAQAEAVRRDPGMTPEEKRLEIDQLGREATARARFEIGRELPDSR